MAGKDQILTGPALDAALAALPDWKYRSGAVVTVFKCPTSAAALELIAAVGRIAEAQNHHPDLDWRYNRVFVRYSSHDAGGEVTERDISAATEVGRTARELGAAPQPERYPDTEPG
ncbi:MULTISPECIES: 4a-hydroxytetrahydrobiopterin dehydratase [Arthrobacter]|uniref:Putative pterin-4-alpha-carbinolamine dehydratase n=1 Tax=Arthrobacter terricola TaxID=2547396 RepID=A0A4R5KD14_9MICC|nr:MULTISPECIES: 4a-hydroxytetrahydrobiopterin dehydratase [Arthrobacter]MBT8162441.1 4a-hydroxytetrahydrobiopterin dehydratase [Arthrobacter sp. GN70]TDF93076.1 4a-hydroxytetrahydrobiopterin dehydratase [Arthrobacter terricola]